MLSYHPFFIRINEPADGAYPVTAVFQGIERRGSIPVEALRLSEAELARSASWLAPDAAGQRLAVDLGSRLLYALLPGDLLTMFREAGRRIAPGERLRILLAEPLPAGLAGIPWELVLLAQGEHPVLSRSPAAPLARLLPAGILPNAAPSGGHLRILAASAFQEETDHGSRGQGWPDALRLLWQHIRRPATLPDLARRLLRGRRFRVDVLAHATRDRLAARLREAAEAGHGYHALHLACPAAAAEAAPAVLLESEGAGADPMTAGELAELAAGPGANLLFLQLSGGAAAAVAAGAAQAALPRGLLAVVSMQVDRPDRAAGLHMHEFYRAWSAGEPLEIALAHAARLVRWLHRGPEPAMHPPLVYVGHAGGLALPRLQRVHVLPVSFRILNWLLGTVLAIVGLTTNVLNLPSSPALCARARR